MLYWTEGEGFSGAATLDVIARFLTHSRDDVLRTLTELVARGDVTHDAATCRVSPHRDGSQGSGATVRGGVCADAQSRPRGVQRPQLRLSFRPDGRRGMPRRPRAAELRPGRSDGPTSVGLSSSAASYGGALQRPKSRQTPDRIRATKAALPRYRSSGSGCSRKCGLFGLWSRILGALYFAARDELTADDDPAAREADLLTSCVISSPYLCGLLTAQRMSMSIFLVWSSARSVRVVRFIHGTTWWSETIQSKGSCREGADQV